MIKILKEYVLKTRDEFDMVVDYIVNKPEFRKYKDWIYFIIDCVEEKCHNENELFIEFVETLKSMCYQECGDNEIFNNFYDYYFNINEKDLANVRENIFFRYTMRDIRDDMFGLADYISKHAKTNEVEKCANKYISKLGLTKEIVICIVNKLNKNGDLFEYTSPRMAANEIITRMNYMEDTNIRWMGHDGMKNVDVNLFTDKMKRCVSSVKVSRLVNSILSTIDYDDVLQKDLFFYDSDVEDEYEGTEDLAKTINNYTIDYNITFTQEQSDKIKRHMTLKDYPLYRIVGFDGSCIDEGYKVGDTIQMQTNDGLDRLCGMASFTSNIETPAMIDMMRSRRERSTSKIVIFETVGGVYSFDVDRLSWYATSMDKCEYEELVSGEFEIVDIQEKNGDYRVKIRQTRR